MGNQNGKEWEKTPESPQKMELNHRESDVESKISVYYEQIKQKTEEYLENWKKIPLKIAVTGQSGTGKSSFINAIRDLPDNRGETVRHPDSATVGTTETTEEPKEFKHPENKNYVLVDLPGVNTPKFPQIDYLEKVKFDEYDCYIIISRGRFSEADHWLADQAKRMKKGFFFVRSQIDVDMKTLEEEDEEGKAFDEESALNSIRNNIKVNLDPKIEENLEEIENSKIFLISSNKKYRNKYDFLKLRQDIATSLPDLKQEVLLRTLKADTKGLIEEKESFLKRRILMYSLSSAAAGAIPIPGPGITADIGIFYRMITEQREQLGITNQDLATAAREMEFSSQYDLINQFEKDGVRKPLPMGTAEMSKEQFIKMLSNLGAAGAAFGAQVGVEEAVKAVGVAAPGVGWAAASAVGALGSFASTYGLGRCILNIHVKFALALVQLRAKKNIESSKNNNN